MTSVVCETCGIGLWRSLFNETVKNIFLGNDKLTVIKYQVK